MSERSVIHDTFVLERSYPVTASRVFGAFASEEAKNTWGDTGDIGEATAGAGQSEFDFRIGGRERHAFSYQDRTFRYDAVYYDIVPEQRIIYSYEMYADDVRISVSVATIEFVKTGDGTALTWTEQGAYLDDFDGENAPQFRREGTEEMIDGLAKYLT